MKPLSQALAFVQRKLIRSADRPASYMSLSNTNGGIYEGAELYAETWIAEKYGPPIIIICPDTALDTSLPSTLKLYKLGKGRCKALSEEYRKICLVVGWIARTFVEGEEAETDLSIDRPRFMQRQDIMELIPRNIKKHITHPGDIGQIHGFQELFVYLERSSASEELRRLIVDYFARSPTLRGHLKKPMTPPTNHHTANPPAANAPPAEFSSAPELQSRFQNDAQPRTGAVPISTADAGDASDDNSAPTSPIREINPGPSAGADPTSTNAKNVKPTPPPSQTGFPRLDADPLSLPPVTQEIFLALGADPADEKLHTFQFKGGALKPSLDVDFLQTHQTYHNIKNANVAFLAFKLRCHEGNRRPGHFVLRGSLRTPLIEFAAIWPPPPSGDLSVPQLTSKSLTATISSSLGIQHIGPTGGISLARSSNVTWLEDRTVADTVFDNTNPRNSFKMTIKPRLGQKEVPDIMAFAVVVKFHSKPQGFALDFDLDRGKNPQSYTAVYDGKTQILKTSNAIPQSYA